MRFSILIPVYNSARYIEECVSSVLRQGFSDYEIILSDDGSTDDSGIICDRLHDLYPETIRVIHNDHNMGLLLNRRRLFQEAVGEWMICVDADDSLEQHALEALFKVIEEHDPDMIIYNLRCYLVSGETEDFKPALESNRLFLGEDKLQVYRCLYENNYINSMCTKACRRDIIDVDADYSKYNVSIGEDAFQTYPLLDNAKRIYYLDEYLYMYRKNENSMTESLKYDYYDAFKPLWDRELFYRDKWKISSDVSKYEDILRTKKTIQYLRKGTNKNGYKWLKSRFALIKKEGYFEKSFLGCKPGKRYELYGKLLLSGKFFSFLLFSSHETFVLKLKS